MLNKIILSVLSTLLLVAPAQAGDDLVLKAESLLKVWREKTNGPDCHTFLSVCTSSKKIQVDTAPPGTPKPRFKELHPSESWEKLCAEFIMPFVNDDIFKGTPFCKSLDATHARCTLMTATSMPLVLTFEVNRACLSGLHLQTIEWQRKTGKPLPPDDDDDLPM